MKPVRLVAHRGSPRQFPENTLSSIEAAVTTGAMFVEVDVQFTRDLVPILCHDPDFTRMSGESGCVVETDFDEIDNLSASFPERFGNKFDSVRIDSLKDFWQKLPAWPDVKVFLDIKSESIDHFGFESVVSILLDSIDEHAVGRQIAAIISKNDNAIEFAKSNSRHAIGWVVPDYSNVTRKRATEIGVDFMLVNKKRLTPWMNEIPDANWKWVVYTVNDADEAENWMKQGVDMVETDVIDVLIEYGDR